MEFLYHRTPSRTWNHIVKSHDDLKAMSNPIWCLAFSKSDFSKRVQDSISSNLYLVGIDNQSDQGWEESGLLEHIKHGYMKEILEVPIFRKSKTFVRDHSVCSPRYFLENFGEDIFAKIRSGNYTSQERDLFLEAYRNYIETTVSLNDYEGGYAAPEIWLPQNTSVSKINHVGREECFIKKFGPQTL